MFWRFGNAGIKAKSSIAGSADLQSLKHLADGLAWDVWRFVPCLVFSILGHDLRLQLWFHLPTLELTMLGLETMLGECAAAEG